MYLDPPYPLGSRSSKAKIYTHEMTDEDHVEFLTTVREIKADCMISTYDNPIYSEMLSDWHLETYMTSIHGQPKKELLYMNYPVPEKLHDYSYLGEDCWDRQRIKRKINRHVKKLQGLPPRERNAIIEALNKST